MKLLLQLSVLLLSAIGTAQQCSFTLTGYVIDLHDQSVLENATIIVAGSEEAVMTDAQGKYRIDGLCAATYSLQVSHPACETQIVRVAVKGNTTRNINLEHHLESLSNVKITGRNQKIKTETGTELLVDDNLLDNNSAGSLGDALRELSGVSSLNTGNSIVKPVIQGLHSSRVIIVTDGTRLEDQQWGVEHAPNIDINAAGNVTVIKGAAGLEYGGDAVGGTIVLDPETIPVKDTLLGRTIMTAATNGRGGSITSSLTKSYNNGWYGSVSGTYKQFGDFEAPDYVLTNTALIEKDVNLRFGINRYRYGIEAGYSLYNKESGILRSSHVGNASDLVVAINNDEPFVVRDFTYDIDAPSQDVTHQLAQINGFYRFDNVGKLTAQVDYQRNNRLELDIRRDSEDTRPAVDLQLETFTAKADFEYTADNTITAKAGLRARYQVNFPDPDTGVRRLIPDYEAYDFGIYALGSKNFGDWVIEGGLRFDYNRVEAEKFYRTTFWDGRDYDVRFPQFEIERLGTQIFTRPEFEYSNFSGTAGAQYNFNDTYSLSGNYALASRSPNVSELFSDGLHQSAARFELGDLSFNQEVAHKFSANFKRTAQNWLFTIAPYASFINDFILIEPTDIQSTTRGPFQVWEYRQTQARLIGVDIDNEVTLTENFKLNNQFSIIKGRDQTRDLPLIDMPAASIRNAVTYMIPEVNNLKLKLESNYVFEQNEFPDNNFEVFVFETDSVETVDVSTPPPAYHLVNFRGDIDFALSEKTNLNVGLTVQNVFDTSYREYLNRQRLFADDLGRNILVQLKINY